MTRSFLSSPRLAVFFALPDFSAFFDLFACFATGPAYNRLDTSSYAQRAKSPDSKAAATYESRESSRRLEARLRDAEQDHRTCCRLSSAGVDTRCSRCRL